MSFQAALLLGLAFIVTEQVKNILPSSPPKWLTPLVSMVIGIAAVFLVAESDWAHEQIIMGQTLDAVNDYSKVVAGILIGIGGSLVDKGLNTVANIGENQPKPPTD